ncbi:MAG: hypothetical protein ACI4OI_02760 [Gemmiger sp.]
MHKKLLQNWCDALLRYQLSHTGDPRLDGGILCPACMRVHGRCADAILPLVTQWQLSGEEKYLTAAEALFDWSLHMVRPDSSYNNDTNSNWNGITVFAANMLGETLLHFGDRLPRADRDKWQQRFAESARYLLHNIEAVGGNINYPITCAYTMALAAKLLPREEDAFSAKGRTLARYAVEHITPDGLLYGEGHPVEAVSPKGCRPVDIGYNVEESLPSLALYAELTGDSQIMQAVLDCTRTHLDFFMPDGGWNNSFGSRSYKWSYWGSRTSDGCLAGFAVLARQDPVFSAVVQKNLALLARCTHEGLLYGGPMYHTAGEPACIHHTFCHAKAAAALVLLGWQEPPAPPALPSETLEGVRRYPTIHTHLLAKGGWHATVTDYDYQYLEGGHPTGGAVSLLWNRQWGPVLAGTMDRYVQNEPNNMQMPRWQFDLCATPRLEVLHNHQRCNSSSDLSAWLQSGLAHNSVWAETCGQLRSAGQMPAGGFRLRYTLSDSGFLLEGSTGAAGAVFHLPVISAGDEAVEGLGSGTVRILRGGLALTVRANRPLAIPSEYRQGAGLRRLFNPVGGFQYLPLVLAADRPLRIQITITQEEPSC